MAVFSTVGWYHDKCGGYLEYIRGILSAMGDIMMHMGGYHEYYGRCSVPWRYSNDKTPRPHGTENPFEYLMILHGTHDTPSYSWYPLTVLSIPHGTQDISPRYSWYASTVLKISPHIYHDITLTVLNIPHGNQDIPTVVMKSPHHTEHPKWYWALPTVLNTRYTECFSQVSFNLLVRWKKQTFSENSYCF